MTWTRFGARAIDMAPYPIVTGYTRLVQFVATLENTLASADWYAEARLFDVTHNVEVFNTLLSNSAETDRSVAKEFTSGYLVVGSASGNVRNDGVTIYSAQFRANGTITDEKSQRAVIGNGRLRIFYLKDV